MICPAAVILSQSYSIRCQARGEFAAMVKHPLYEHYGGEGHQALIDSGRYDVQEAKYVARRMAEFRRWNPGKIFVG